MSGLSAEELRHRLEAITSGPWADGVLEAQRELAPIDGIALPTKGAPRFDLRTIQLSSANRKRSELLKTVLRPHFDDPDGVTDPTEIETRDAFDSALMLPQLYELAVQTGYLSAEQVQVPARKLLADLLWSSAARGFVADYDYVSVPMLSARLGIVGLGSVQPPEPNPNSALRFAGFLAHLREFYADEQIEAWTRFLDDILDEENEKEHVWRYLRGKRKAPPKRMPALLGGCQRFVSSLAGAFYFLDDEELGNFGLIHAYWLQKFLGFEVNRGGYVKDIDNWGRTDSWARTIASSEHVVAADVDARIAAVARQQFGENVLTLERAFDAVRRLTSGARSGSDPSNANGIDIAELRDLRVEKREAEFDLDIE